MDLMATWSSFAQLQALMAKHMDSGVSLPIFKSHVYQLHVVEDHF